MATLTKVAVLALVPAFVAFGGGCSGNIGNKGGNGAAAGTGAGTGAGAGNGSGLGGQGGGVTSGTAGSGNIIVTTPPVNPGAVVLRRLNHDEYNNSVRDLLGTTLT